MAIELQDKLYTSAQVADVLGVSLRTLYRYMEDGRIESMKTASGRHRFTKEQILDFLDGGDEDFTGNEVQNREAPVSQRNDVQSQQMRRAPVNDFNRGQDDDFSFYGANRSVSNSYGDVNNDPYKEDVPSSDNSRVLDNENLRNIDNSRSNYSNFDDVDDFDFNINQTKSNDLQEEDLDNSFSNRNPFSSQVADQSQRRRPVASENLNRSVPRARERRGHDFDAPRPGRGFSTGNNQALNREQSQSAVSAPKPRPAVDPLNVRYYKSEYNDLIDLAKRVKDTALSKDLEYAFTLDAGLSLHYPIDPFTVLHFYINPEDLQLWKSSLGLIPVSNKDEANIGVFINTDIVFVPTKEIVGFKVLEDKLLLKDLMRAGEDALVREFRQKISNF